MSLVLRIVIGLVIGTTLGLLCPRWQWLAVLGQLFVTALKAIAPILVGVLVTASLARANTHIGKRTGHVITRYLLTTVLAAGVAVAASFLFPVRMALTDAGAAAGAGPGGLSDIFMGLITRMVANPVEALAQGNYLAVLFWGIMLGLALRSVAGEKTLSAVSDLADAISRVVKWVIQFAPFGILGLSYAAVSRNGLEIFTTYGALLAVIVGSMLVTAFVINPLLVALSLRTNPYPLVWLCIRESGLNAFFTRSSAANIPVNLDLCERLGIERDFYSVTIPLGSTINMSGAAVTISVMSLAVCHTLGIEVTVWSALLLCILSTLAACGSSGVAGGSLLLIPMACSLFGIGNDIAMQAVGVGFIIGVIQDSFETALNSSSDVLFTADAEFHDGDLSPAEIRRRIRDAR